MDTEARIETRLARLETRVRRWQAACIATLALAGVAVAVFSSRPTVAQQQPGAAVSDVLRAKKLEIVNDAGRAVVVIGSVRDDGVAVVNTKDGSRAVVASGSATGNGITVYMPNGKPGATVNTIPGNKANLTISDANGQETHAFPSH